MSIFTALTEAICRGLSKEGGSMSEKEFFEAEIMRFMGSSDRKRMIDGERYYRGEHDILQNERTAIGKDGRLKRIDNLPNNKLIDNVYQRLVNQKVNYLLGREMVIAGEDRTYIELLKKVLGKNFQRMLKSLMRDAINMGIGWLYVYTDEEGLLKMKRIPAYEIIPYWSDSEHTILDRAVRIYEVEGYKGKREYTRVMVEIYSKDKVEVFELEDGVLKKEEEFSGYKAGKIPLIAFKYNEKEIPLIDRVKSLQDALNKTVSDFENNMQEDSRNSILVLQNYDGTDLGEFRQNLATYGAVKVKSVDGLPGDIKVLNTKFDGDNYTALINVIKNAIIENGMGYDAKSDRLGTSPNQLVIKSMFADLDLDVCEIEVEFGYAFEALRAIIDEYLENVGYGYFENEKVKLIFNRDCIVNESEAIDNCIKSMEVLSEDTVLMMHPWVEDALAEKNKKKGEVNG